MTIEINIGTGVNLITGPTASGKTKICHAVTFGLAGHLKGAPSHETVSLHLPSGMVVQREQKKNGEHVVSVIDANGVASNDPAESLNQMGVNQTIYTLGVKGIYSHYYAAEPPFWVKVNGSPIDIRQSSAENANATYNKLLGEQKILQSMIEQTELMIDRVSTEVEALTSDVSAMKINEQVQYAHSMLFIMESGECPIYALNCTCKDEIVRLTKEDMKRQVQGVKPLPAFYETMKKKESELASKELLLTVIRDGWKNSEGVSVQEQLKEVERLLSMSGEIKKAVEAREEWKHNRNIIKPFVRIKDQLVSIAKSIGLDLTFNGIRYLLHGKDVAIASASEQILLEYCLQQAAELPLVIIDDFGSLDITWKERVFEHAKTASDNRIIVLLASSSEPKKYAGVNSWHLSDGSLERVA